MHAIYFVVGLSFVLGFLLGQYLGPKPYWKIPYFVGPILSILIGLTFIAPLGIMPDLSGKAFGTMAVALFATCGLGLTLILQDHSTR